MGKLIDISGTKVGRLQVLHFVDRTPGNKVLHYLCRCDCGNEPIVQSRRLRAGLTLSCGCFRAEKATRHSLSRHPLYMTWHGMIARCYKPKAVSYRNYGGRGISVCDEWRGDNGLQTFITDMGARPRGHTLERVSGNKPYSKANCRWATPKEQSRNSRANVFITFSGVTLCLKDWSDRLKIDRAKIRHSFRSGPDAIERLFRENENKE